MNHLAKIKKKNKSKSIESSRICEGLKLMFGFTAAWKEVWNQLCSATSAGKADCFAFYTFVWSTSDLRISLVPPLGTDIIWSTQKNANSEKQTHHIGHILDKVCFISMLSPRFSERKMNWRHKPHSDPSSCKLGGQTLLISESWKFTEN